MLRNNILVIGILFSGMCYAMEIPKILVNHDLFSHELNSGDGINRDAGGYSTRLTPNKTVELLNYDIDDIHSRNMGFSLNTVYGAHNIAYWYPNSILLKDETITTYKNWFDKMKVKVLGENNSSIDDILNDTDTGIDNLIKYKLLGSASELFSRLDVDEDKKLIASYRINDYHHLNRAIDFMNAIDDNKTIDLKNNSRQLAAISPEFMYFLKKGSVVSTTKGLHGYTTDKNEFILGHGIGKEGKNEDNCHNYPVLDMGDEEVLLHKKREVWRLLMLDNIGGVEIDFTRSSCLFSKDLKPVSRGAIIRDFLGFVIRATGIKNKKLILNFPSDINWKRDFGFNIRSFVARNHRNIDVIITGGRIGLRATLPKKDPFDLLSMREKFHTLNIKINTKFYHQINNIVDAYNNKTTQLRRPISLKELRGIASLAKDLEYDGLNLFNFQYLFPMQRKLNFEEHQKVTWDTLSRLFSNLTDVDNAEKGRAYYISGQINSLKFNTNGILNVEQVLPKGDTLNGTSILLRIKTKLNTNLTVSINDKCNVRMRNESSLSGLHPLEHLYREGTDSTVTEKINFWAGSDFVQYAWIKTNCLLGILDKNKFKFKNGIANKKVDFIEILERN